MKTTAEFLDALRAKLDLPSDGRLADHLGMHRQHVSHYRTLNGTFSDELCLKVADILETDPAYVIACMHAQREKNEQVRKVWQRIANLSIGVTAVLAVVTLLPIAGVSIGDNAIIASTSPAVAGSGRCILCQTAIVNYWPFLALFVALILALPRQTLPKTPATKSGK